MPVSVVAAPFLRSASGGAARVLLRMDVAVDAYLDAQALGQRVDDRDADACRPPETL